MLHKILVQYLKETKINPFNGKNSDQNAEKLQLQKKTYFFIFVAVTFFVLLCWTKHKKNKKKLCWSSSKKCWNDKKNFFDAQFHFWYNLFCLKQPNNLQKSKKIWKIVFLVAQQKRNATWKFFLLQTCFKTLKNLKSASKKQEKICTVLPVTAEFDRWPENHSKQNEDNEEEADHGDHSVCGWWRRPAKVGDEQA